MEPENSGLEIAKSFAGAVGKEGANRFANFISGLFPYWGLEKKAVDVYVHEIEKSNMSPEAKLFAIANTKKTFWEWKNQTAIINAAYDAIGTTPDADIDADTSPSFDNELVSRLIDAGKFVSDEELQLLWGNVLAGEFENPGETPKNVVRILSELSKTDATVFSNLCSLKIDILADTGSELKFMGSPFMVFQKETPYLSEMNINQTAFRELDHFGLINYNDASAYSKRIACSDFPYIHLVSGTEVITIHNNNNEKRKMKDTFPCGLVILTAAGESISQFVPMRYNQQHIDTIKNYLKNSGIEMSPAPGLAITQIKNASGKCIAYDYQRLPMEP